MKQALSILLIFVAACSTSKKTINNSLPVCLQKKIDALTNAHNTPQSVTRYDYKGEQVYYILSACCDQYNIVYDSNCSLLGYPDGGITGRGNGSMPGFQDSATNKVIIWQSQ